MNQMPHRRCRYEISLPVRSPVLTAGLSQAGLGIDKSMARNELGEPILPMDHLRGLLLAAFSTLARKPKSGVDLERVASLFGRPADEGDYEPYSARIILSDFVADLCGLPQPPEPSVRIRIDAETGAADEGALLFVEQIAPCETEIPFRGELIAYLTDEEREDFERWLKKALRLIPAVGSMKSAGFGEVVRDKIEVVQDRTVNVGSVVACKEVDRLQFEVEFDRPLLVDAERASDNVFVGRTVIPGTVIKGALARKLQLAGGDPQKNTALSAIIVSHAFPLDAAGARELDLPMPQSLVAAAGEIYSALEAERGIVARREKDGKVVFVPAAFPGDWKSGDWTKAQQALCRPAAETIRKLQRTRVRIDAATWSASEQGLFTVVARSERIDGKAKRRWRFTVDRNDADAAEFHSVMTTLSGGLDAVGRSDARMNVVLCKEAPAIAEPQPLRDNHWVVMLKTPALMTDPDDPREAKQQYQAYWQWAFEQAGLSGNVTLKHFFARQSWAGGYVGKRFRAYGPDRYCPFMLTEAGAVFLLEGELQQPLRTLLRTGLPALPPKEGGKYQLTWQDTPYVPGNGYGQIVVDPEPHRRLAWKEGQ
jgi:hypothetical protein